MQKDFHQPVESRERESKLHKNPTRCGGFIPNSQNEALNLARQPGDGDYLAMSSPSLGAFFMHASSEGGLA